MKSKWIPVAMAWIAVASVGGLMVNRNASVAQTEPTAKPAFELRDGDCVVLLGGTMIEREQRFGSWELLMTAQHPQQNITFRNLGWSGDTVWAESRGIFDSPAQGYQRMIAQVLELKPTVLILGYGANESFAGDVGLEKFLAQYKKLLNNLAPTKARLVFLGPPAHYATAFPIPHLEKRQAELKLYSDAIEKLAKEQNAPFVDFYREIQRWIKIDQDSPGEDKSYLCGNGVHWTELGYWLTGEYLAQTFGWSFDGNCKLTLTAEGKATRTQNVKIQDLKSSKEGLEFTATLETLPCSSFRPRLNLIVKGLKPGLYILEIDGQEVTKSFGHGWDDGRLVSGPEVEQSEKLRQVIREKNRLYFYRWRPQNVTYLFGFRKHEQGQNAKEVLQFGPLIAEKEQVIHQLKQPKLHKYVLRRVSD